MTKKTFDEQIENLKEAAGKSTVFSKKAFESLVLAFANDREREFGYAKVRGGELVLETEKPAKFFEKLVYEVLVSNGHDKQEAQSIAANYQFGSMDGAYLAFSEAIFSWMETGKSFDLPKKADFKGSLYLRDREAGVTDHKVAEKLSGVPGGTIVKVKKEKHRTLERKSGAPDWLRAKL